jgi:hypothetical protein
MRLTDFKPRQQPGRTAFRAAMVDRRARGAFGQVWAVVAEAAPRLFEGRVPGSPADLGAGKGEKVDRNDSGPVSLLVESFAAGLGINRYEIYLTTSDAEMVDGVGSDPPVIVVGTSVVTSMNAVRRFHMGRALSLMRDQAFALELLQPEELELMLCGAIYSVSPEANLPVPVERAEAEAKRVTRALSRKARKALPVGVSAYVQKGDDFASWRSGVLSSANRAGLLVCGDIVTALEQRVSGLAERRAEGAGAEQVMELVKQDREASNLMVFSVSGEYLQFRKDLGI